MSAMKLNDIERSVNERKSITGINFSSHNLTGPRARFQPVRIKALLSLYENEDDDTEPRDSEDDSDTESLQALPDDDDDDDYDDKQVRKTVEIAANIPLNNFVPTNDNGLEKLCELEDAKRSHNLMSFYDFKNVGATSCSDNISRNPVVAEEFDVAKFTPRVGEKKPEACGDENVNVEIPRLVRSCLKFDKAKIETERETPLKESAFIQSRRNELETPRNKVKGENSRCILDTPAAIFSHWSRNNFFQTPNQRSNNNSGVSAVKETISLPVREQKETIQAMNDRLLKPHRLCSSDNNKLARKPLSEAIRLNEGSRGNENGINQFAERHTLVRRTSHLESTMESPYHNVQSNLTTKENCSKDVVKGNEAASIVACSAISSLTTSEERFDCRKKLEDFETAGDGVENEVRKASAQISEREKELGLVLRFGESFVQDNQLLRGSNGCDDEIASIQNDPEIVLNSRKNSLDRLEHRNSALSKSDATKIDPPLMMGRDKPSVSLKDDNCKGNNPGNVQFSLAAKPSDKRHGKLINVKGSDYLILGKLGQGMSGEVLRVQEIRTGELRAIKCVDLSSIEKETAQGCLEEVSMLDRLRAPCIINMITYEIRSHLLYVVLEMGDTDLNKLLKSMSKEKQLPLTMILYYWTEMLTAVKHIHDNGVIHSDLKPANFLLVRGRLKLIDFGIASIVNADMTSVVKNTSLGTLNYISPEAIMDVGGNGDSSSDEYKYKINFKSDVWSLGCILYSLVYGQTPFQHIRADWAKVSAITNPNQKIAFPPSESTTRRGYTSPPPFLVDVMRRCLQHDRRARPTVSQLLQIPYVGCNCPTVSSLPNISPNILSKIKHSLEESEWRQLLEALERRKPVQ